MGQHAELGKDFRIISQPGQPIVVVISAKNDNSSTLPQWHLHHLATVLAELRARYPKATWQVIPNKTQKLDLGPRMDTYEVVEHLAISFDQLT